MWKKTLLIRYISLHVLGFFFFKPSRLFWACFHIPGCLFLCQDLATLLLSKAVWLTTGFSVTSLWKALVRTSPGGSKPVCSWEDLKLQKLLYFLLWSMPFTQFYHRMFLGLYDLLFVLHNSFETMSNQFVFLWSSNDPISSIIKATEGVSCVSRN